LTGALNLDYITPQMKPNIPKHPNKHITKNGQLFSYNGEFWREIKPRVNPVTGYCQFFFRQDGIVKSVLAHRLVAMAHKNLSKEDYVTLRDGDKENFKLSNLKVVSRKKFFSGVGKSIAKYWGKVYSGEIKPLPRVVGENNFNAKLTNNRVKKIRELRGIKTYSQMAEKYGVNRFTICKAANKKSWKHIK